MTNNEEPVRVGRGDRELQIKWRQLAKEALKKNNNYANEIRYGSCGSEVSKYLYNYIKDHGLLVSEGTIASVARKDPSAFLGDKRSPMPEPPETNGPKNFKFTYPDAMDNWAGLLHSLSTKGIKVSVELRKDSIKITI